MITYLNSLPFSPAYILEIQTAKILKKFDGDFEKLNEDLARELRDYHIRVANN